MNKRAATWILCLSIAAAVVIFTPLFSEAVSIKEGAPACTKEDLFSQWITAQNKKDKRAAGWLLENGCIITASEFPATILDTTWTGTAKLRIYAPDGQAFVVWTYIEAVNK